MKRETGHLHAGSRRRVGTDVGRRSTRRALLAAGAALLALPPATFAQPSNVVPRVGYIGPLYYADFQKYMRELGYVEGRNIVYERRDTEGDLARIPVLVRELVEQRVRVLVAPNNVAVAAAKNATATIPIVMVASIDPVAAGFVSTLARPGANITGVASLLREVSAKRIELIREVLPRFSRLAVLWDEGGPGPKVAVKEYEAAAKALKVRFQSLPVRGPKPELEVAFRGAKAEGAEAIIVVANPTLNAQESAVIELSDKYRLPLIAERSTSMTGGALMFYGPSSEETSQRIAAFVHRILKGANPADLPVEQATKFELGVNMKTAKALSITIPQSVVVRAERVIK